MGRWGERDGERKRVVVCQVITFSRNALSSSLFFLSFSSSSSTSSSLGIMFTFLTYFRLLDVNKRCYKMACKY